MKHLQDRNLLTALIYFIQQSKFMFMEAAVLKSLEHRLTIYKSEKNMLFEIYATEQAIELLKKRGTDSLIESLEAAINSKGVHPAAKMFFMDLRNRINKY